MAAKAGATFFVTGDSVRERPDVLRRIAENTQFEVGGHSLTHPDLWKVSDEQGHAEVVECKELIEDSTGRTVTLFRPPYGHHDERTRLSARESGQAIIMWSLTSLDWKHRSATETARIVARSARDGDIVLLHDSVASTVEGTRAFLTALTAKGFTFVTVTELLGPLHAGVVYSGRVGRRTVLLRRGKRRSGFAGRAMRARVSGLFHK